MAAGRRLVVVLTATAAALVLAGSGRATFPGRNGLIVFTSPGAAVPPRVLAFDPRGGSNAGVAAPAMFDLNKPAAWSPNGRRLAFVRAEQLDPRLGFQSVVYVSGPHGVGEAGIGDWPAWSPDGGRLAFFAYGRGGALSVADLRTGLARRLAVDGGPPAWSPDGKRLVYGTSRLLSGVPGLWVVRASGGRPRPVGGRVSVHEAPAWSRDGRRIAFVDDRTNSLRLLDLRTGRTTVLARAPASGSAAPAWSPRRGLLAYAGTGGALHVVHEDGSHDRLLARVATGDASFAWSPDARRLAVLDGSVVSVVSVADGRQRRLVGGPHQTIRDLAWPRANRILIVDARETQHIVVAQPDGSEPRQLTRGPWWDSGPRWSPDGRTIAFASDRDGDDELFLMNADGSGVRQLTHNTAADIGPSWSPDGTQLAFASDRGGTWGIWAIQSDGSHPHELAHGGQAGVYSPVWSPDGRWIAYGRIDQPAPAIPTSVIAHADTSAVACTSAYYPVAWSPDSRQLELGPNKLGEADTIDNSCQPQPSRTADGRPFLWAPDGRSTLPCAPFSANGCDADWQALPTQRAGGRATDAQVTVTGAVAWSPSRPEIAFGAAFAGREGIAVSRVDGSALRLLTPWPDTDSRAGSSFDPVWAPGGGRLAFSSFNQIDGTSLVRVIGRDGRGLRTAAVGDSPGWAPDGQRLVFETFDPTASPAGVEVADLRTGLERQLVPWSTSAPEWAPSGRLIAFGADAAGTGRSFVFLIRPDAGGLRRLTAGSAPVWSSDGRLLAYNAAGSVYVIRPDGTERRRLTGVPAPGQADEKAWARRRRLLAVLIGYGPYDRRGGFVVDVTTGHVRRVLGATTATDAFGPSWSRDGRSLAFVTRLGRIFVVRADGSDGHFLRLRPPAPR